MHKKDKTLEKNKIENEELKKEVKLNKKFAFAI